jgi:hypothetical protein
VPVDDYPEYPADRVPQGESLQPCLCIRWDMRVEGPAGVVNPNPLLQTDFGPYFAVEANDDETSAIGLLGSLGVDATTGEVLYQAPGTGFLTPAGPVTTFGTWHNYQIKLDYSTHEYTIYYDKVAQGTFPFVDHTLANQLNEFSEGNITALAAAGDTQANLNRAGMAFFDNYIVQEGMCMLIPEPTTFGLLAMGVVMVPWIARRQRRASCH